MTSKENQNEKECEIKSSLDLVAEKLIQLKKIIPEIFSENKIDIERLKQIFDLDIFVQNEHYELSWADKFKARSEIKKTTSNTLLPDKNNTKNEQHIFIEGENLEVLRVLQKSYLGKVKLIYIDPPYNTGNDSFIYPDDYSENLIEYKKRTGLTDKDGYINKQEMWRKNSKESGQYHSIWLSMLFPRLYLAKNLLHNDGVIFISIDDNEASNLKLLCDEIFGQENFVAQLPRVTKRGGKSTDAIAKNHDYILCYSKSSNPVFIPFEHNDKGFKYKDEFYEERGFYKLNQTLDYDTLGYINSLDYEIVIGNESYFPGSVTKEDFLKRKKDDPKDGYRWRWSPDLFEFGYKNGFVEVNKKTKRVYTKTYQLATIEDDGEYYIQYENRTKVLSSLEFLDNAYSNDNAKKDVKKILGKAIFDYPKPTSLIKKLVKFTTKEDDIVLDFFSGSGTTAQAVMEVNLEDNGNRQFICVQMPELIDESSSAFKEGYRNIADITFARINKCISKLKADHPNEAAELKCAKYKLGPSNFKVWQSDVSGEKSILKQLEIFQNSENENSPHDYILVELLLKMGLGLEMNLSNTKTLTFSNINVYEFRQSTDTSKWFCFSQYSDELKKEIIKAKPEQIIFLNTCFTGDKADEQLTNLKLELKNHNIKLLLI